jgi:SAM-dependent methyltransferase
VSQIEKAKEIKAYFQEKLDLYGPTPQGVDWNSSLAQELRFDQLLKVCGPSRKFSILDFGCGYGALADYMRKKGLDFEYFGYDFMESMISKARENHKENPEYIFLSDESKLPQVDYALECGIFNLKPELSFEKWTLYVLDVLNTLNHISSRGFSMNFLTKYSDPEYMKPHLYYADPCFMFDYCKTHFSRNVALLHDYNLYDFTILVRKVVS